MPLAKRVQVDVFLTLDDGKLLSLPDVELYRLVKSWFEKRSQSVKKELSFLYCLQFGSVFGRELLTFSEFRRALKVDRLKKSVNVSLAKKSLNRSSGALNVPNPTSKSSNRLWLRCL